MGRRGLAAAVVMVGVLLVSGARAAEDVRALEKQLADEVSTLSTSNCSLACRALASIRRAAERICALEPGPRCDAARAKVAEATRRVQDACPECLSAEVPLAKEEAAPPAPSSAEVATRAEPRGGCRSCTIVSGPGELDPSWWLLAAWSAWRLRRLPKKSRRRP